MNLLLFLPKIKGPWIAKGLIRMGRQEKTRCCFLKITNIAHFKASVILFSGEFISLYIPAKTLKKVSFRIFMPE
jgi:hypothetical protein